MLVKIGVITNGISEDLEYALKVMNKTGVKYVCRIAICLGQGSRRSHS